MDGSHSGVIRSAHCDAEPNTHNVDDSSRDCKFGLCDENDEAFELRLVHRPLYMH